MATNSSGAGASQVFLMEDMMNNILLRLPTASSIARFRCVCRSWRILLSDPQFILKILFSPNNPGPKNSSSHQQILIKSGADPAAAPSSYRYSLHSYDTLSPASASTAAGDLPSFSSNSALLVAGCCRGIFCIVEMKHGGPDVILWNPATSETKLLPVSTALPPRRRNINDEYISGFGFDPETNDYKIARILFFPEDDFHEYDIAPRETLSDVTIAEVYSLKNHSWKRITVPDGLIMEKLSSRVENIDPRDQWGDHDDSKKQSKRHCYWFYACFAHCFTLSFDTVEEVFEYTAITLPPVLRDDTFMDSRGSFMLKDSVILAVFCDGDDNYSMWCMLKHGVADSWTQLHAFRPPVFSMEFLETWKEDRYICSRESRGCHPASDPKEAEETDGVWVFFPFDGEIW
ncbi:unnamed protein product [Linum tenue]|uniref:F-box domain-containing protein n=1 Tax=Linum tenue TaxID=586396 RepID=A0AAV0IB36_9ROSI|nr:unnamed protein product [Linum tenue]